MRRYLNGAKKQWRCRDMSLPKETLEFFEGDELRAKVFINKYALRDGENLLEFTPEQMWGRIAKHLAPFCALSESEIYNLLKDFKFVPGGRILFGIGNFYVRSTPFNCFFIPIHDDSIEGIYRCAAEMARTYSFGGGVGTDISPLRPINSPVNNSARFSTGAVSFMELFSVTTSIIGQAGRRGALMITIEDTHPDVLEFIKVKDDPRREKVRYANISVKVSDALISHYLKGRKWTLEFKNDKVHVRKVVKADEVVDELVVRAHSCAEPGVIFWDRVKEFSNTEGYETGRLMGTNPCSEQPLPAYGNCNLGSINLAYFVKDGSIDWASLEATVRAGVRFLDGVINYAAHYDAYPLPQMKEIGLFERRIGLGIMGLADMLLLLGIRYEDGVDLATQVMRKIALWAYSESVLLAKELGSCPAISQVDTNTLNFVKKVIAKEDRKLGEEILQGRNLRNMTLLTIAPTGSIAILAGVSSGIEPIFAPAYLRRTEGVGKGEHWVWHPTVVHYLKSEGVKVTDRTDPRDLKFPSHFVFAHQIDPMKRVAMQGGLQKYVDAAISSTVNLPEHTTVETVRDIVLEAWEAGCKGITVYREGSREGILVTPEHAQKQKGLKRKPRPYILQGRTFKMQCEAGSLYITVNTDEENNPFEVFIHLGKAGTTVNTLTEALGRVLSLALQYSVPPIELINQLEGIKAGESKHTQGDGEVTTSIPDAIALALEKVVGVERSHLNQLRQQIIENGEKVKGYDICPVCGGVVMMVGSCQVCLSCASATCS